MQHFDFVNYEALDLLAELWTNVELAVRVAMVYAGPYAAYD